MATPHALFNNKLMDFLDDIKSIVGHLPEYAVLTSSVKFLSNFQEEQNSIMFDRYVVVPYGDQIKARDEAFMLGQSYNDSGVVAMLKSVWCSLSEPDRESVWAHMHVLLVLALRCRASS